jgi:quercetin dioxygenase-like cupin family protein
MGARAVVNHPDVTQADTLAIELLAQAREHHCRRAARTLVTGTSQRVTLIALAEGAELAEYDVPPAATLHVLAGHVRLHTHNHEWTLDKGHLIAIPPERHGRRL